MSNNVNNNLNLRTYKELRLYSGFKNQNQVDKSKLKLEGPGMSIILGSPLSAPYDLVRIIHMVYAWMPKMLRSFNANYSKENFKHIYQLAKKARSGNISLNEERSLYVGLAELTNNHMVGASKVLMVLNSIRYPIFDSKVITAWNAFFDDRPSLNVVNLTNPSVKHQKKMIANYKYYQDTLIDWAQSIGKNIIDIEFLFWIAG